MSEFKGYKIEYIYTWRATGQEDEPFRERTDTYATLKKVKNAFNHLLADPDIEITGILCLDENGMYADTVSDPSELYDPEGPPHVLDLD